MTVKEVEQLIACYGTSIYSFCCHLTGSSDLADDLYQDTLLRAVEIRGKIDSADSKESYLSARNYLIGIAIRLWKNQKKRNYKTQFNLSLDDSENGIAITLSDQMNVEMKVEECEMTEHLQCVVKRLPDKLRIVIYMYYTVEMSIEDISKELQIPKGTVKSRMHIARKRIAKEMEAMGYEI